MPSDVSVRPARLLDADRLAEVQARSWAACVGVLPAPVRDRFDADAADRAWQRAVVAPPSPRHRVLAAVAGDSVVGLAALGPALDPDLDPDRDAELLVLCVDPDRRREGHGSRLLAAAAEEARAGSADRLVVWLPARDAATRAFLEGAGFAADGAVRTLDLDGDGSVQLGQQRLAAALAEDSP